VFKIRKVTASESVMLSSTIHKDSILVSEHSAHAVTEEDKYRYIVRMSLNRYVTGDSHSFIKNIFKRILTVGLKTVK
jgi:hypothetical protein